LFLEKNGTEFGFQKKVITFDKTNNKTNNKMENKMEKIIQSLKESTKSLKDQFLKFNEVWAEKEFFRIKEWIDDYRNERIPMDKNMRKYYNLPSYLIRDITPENHIEISRKKSINHYESSIVKLAVRIKKYDLNSDRLIITSSHIGVNLDCTLTDGEKTIRAFTIIASGDIQKPHYRFLIK
jgi:hypothetical protein